jgi:hypothetical protein
MADIRDMLEQQRKLVELLFQNAEMMQGYHNPDETYAHTPIDFDETGGNPVGMRNTTRSCSTI